VEDAQPSQALGEVRGQRGKMSKAVVEDIGEPVRPDMPWQGYANLQRPPSRQKDPS